MRLAGRVALVTGAGAGIGRTIASRLAVEGAAVMVDDVDLDSAAETFSEIRDAGGEAAFTNADVTDDTAALVREVEARFGGLDILVNNAGGYETPVFPDAPIEHWSAALDLNLRAVMLGIHAAVPALERRGGGAIVNIASSAGLGFGPYEGAPEYAAAKAGVMRLTACLASLKDRGIRVNCVCPHTVATPSVLAAIAEIEGRGGELPKALRDVPLEPREVADAVLDLVADQTHAGRVLVLRGDEPPRLLPTD